MMIETVGGTQHTLNGVEDQVFLSLEHEADNNVYTDGLSARDFISIGQNVLALQDVDGYAEVGLATDAFMRMAVNLDDGGGPFTDLGKGLVTATVTVADIHGNVASASSSEYVDPNTVDDSAETLTGIDIDNDTSFADRITSDGSLSSPTNVEMTDGVPATVYYSMNGTDGWVTDPDTLSLVQGSNTVSFKQVDAAGNESTVASVTFDYDTVAPSVDSITDTAGVDTAIDTDDHVFHGQLQRAGRPGDAVGS